jgi:hypothetical protein
MMDPIQRAVAKPPHKIVMQRAARRKVFWDVPPLAAVLITPFMTARMSVRRLLPPRLAGGINGSTYAHSSSVRSLGYLK